MIKAVLAGILTGVVLLGCGGGGGGDGVATGTSSSSISSTDTSSTGSTSSNTQASTGTVSSIPVTKGDSYTYRRTDTTMATSSATTFDWTREFTAVNSDGSLAYSDTFSNGSFAGSSANISADGSISSTSSISSSTATCTYAGVNASSVAPFAVGQSWNNAWTKTCGTAVVAGANKGSIVGQETVTVPAGTFNAYKEVYTVTTQQTSPSSPTITITSYTCWRDAILGQRVKCEWTMATTTAGSTAQTPVSSTVFELTNYIAQASTTSVLSASRFAGTWTGSFSGTDSGTCSNLSISTSGVISGTCVGNQSGTFSVSGTVDSQGAASFSSGTTSNGAHFTGQFASSTAASGTWSAGTGWTGNWTISHK
ncbi:hypothetical protein [Noviherbaspirillum sp.]|uniref:hypothetical protein n=1 Tax=Noviherbaspirillum sp. TaxID=1926288 RepID=UPI002B45F23B|nr:hypothetical protein [Noviherbaspirillum sp.]HJV82980.1 hypothetical protein [Noviherbaspirillum sp.]